MQYDTLKVSAEFRRIRGGVRVATPLFIVEGRERPAAHAVGGGEGGSGSGVAPMPSDGADSQVASGAAPRTRVGFTITRKVGNAVIRNRIRRRLKEALRHLEPGIANPSYDYVVVASRPAHDYPFGELKDALRAAFSRLAEQQRTGKGGAHARPHKQRARSKRSG
ncbi:MAG: ribonuclease P protein component [Hyphomicrobiaceae bacterium]